MKMQVTKRISELLKIQDFELSNNFPNGDLWNECDDKIYRLQKYFTENKPINIIDENGYVIGEKYDSGIEIYFTGMTFENSY